MKLVEIANSRLLKWVGVPLVLYFALFSNNDHPKALSNRFSSENVKEGIGAAKEKGKFIIQNINEAKSMARDSALKAPETTSREITTEDIEIGAGELSLSCGDEAEISYGIYDENGKQIKFINSEKIIIGSQAKVFLEKNISGMKLGGMRAISLPRGSQVTDLEIVSMMAANNSGLKIQATLLSFSKTTSQNLSCN
ncbi:MAG: hypothetical protein KA100_07095 [Rickettsiales bacterium]|nr:hypothetical protein [Rickettsiales bacterium]